MATGKIKNLVSDRGFGFIAVEGSSEEVFFHRSALTSGDFEGLQVGQSVEFDMERDPRDARRMRAGNVRVGAGA
jgi:CspA family cold shock protein